MPAVRLVRSSLPPSFIVPGVFFYLSDFVNIKKVPLAARIAEHGAARRTPESASISQTVLRDLARSVRPRARDDDRGDAAVQSRPTSVVIHQVCPVLFSFSLTYIYIPTLTIATFLLARVGRMLQPGVPPRHVPHRVLQGRLGSDVGMG